MLAESSNAHAQYDQAVDELQRRCDQAIADADLAFETQDYAWVYQRNDAGEWVAQDPAAPAWSWEAWRAGTIAVGATPDQVDDHERFMRSKRSCSPHTSRRAPRPVLK